jgi:hypothetical protein
MLTTLLFCVHFCLQFLAAAPVDVREIQQPESVIEWLTEKDHDFGQIRKGYPVKFTFKFKNISKEPITLQTVRTTCGCTAADYTEDAVLPGDIGEIRIEYDAFKSGDFRKKIRVFFNAQRKAEFLWIAGSVD